MKSLPGIWLCCGQCGQKFGGPDSGSLDYGELLLWSESGEVRYLNALTNREFMTFKTFVRGLVRELTGTAENYPDIVQELFGTLVVDSDSRKRKFSMLSGPICPVCASPASPCPDAHTFDRHVDVELIATSEWARKSQREQASIISTSVRAYVNMRQEEAKQLH